LFTLEEANPGQSYLEISIDKTTIRTILLSTRDSLIKPGDVSQLTPIGLSVSIGETRETSTTCFTSETGLSTWFMCDGLIGSKIFLT
jgi:hypothetical protein